MTIRIGDFLSENHILKGLKHMKTGAMDGQTLEYLLEMYLEEWGKIEIRGRWEEENRNKPIEVRNYKDKSQANKKKMKRLGIMIRQSMIEIEKEVEGVDTY